MLIRGTFLDCALAADVPDFARGPIARDARDLERDAEKAARRAEHQEHERKAAARRAERLARARW